MQKEVGVDWLYFGDMNMQIEQRCYGQISQWPAQCLADPMVEVKPRAPNRCRDNSGAAGAHKRCKGRARAGRVGTAGHG